jgi:hypothetical protein
MISQQEHFGQAKYLEIAEDTNLYFGRFRVWNVSATIPGLSLILPPVTDIPLGGPVFFLINSGSESFDVLDYEESLIISLDADDNCKIVRCNNNWLVI